MLTARDFPYSQTQSQANHPTVITLSKPHAGAAFDYSLFQTMAQYEIGWEIYPTADSKSSLFNGPCCHELTHLMQIDFFTKRPKAVVG